MLSSSALMAQEVLRLLTWKGYAPAELVKKFEDQTGIKVKLTYSNNEEMVAKLRATRGAGSIRPENTMSAFKEAIKRSDIIELDVTLTKDGVAVVIHDDTLIRTSNVKDFPEFKKSYRVIDYTYKELKKLDFSSWFIRDDPFGTIKDGTVKIEELKNLKTQRIPTLNKVLKFLRKHRFPVNIEIKDLSRTPYDKIVAKKVVEIIEENLMVNYVLVSSFNHKYLREIKKYNPYIDIAALQEKKHPKDYIKYLKSLKVRSYHISFEMVNIDLIQNLNNAGIFTNVFTVNDSHTKQNLFKNGVKAIFTDILDG